MRRNEVKLCLGACGAPFSDGFLLSSQGLLFVMAAETIDFTAEAMSLTAASYVFGSFFGSFIFGHLSDRFGRSYLYRALPWLIVTIGIFQFLSYSVVSWCLSRFLFGLLTGGDLPVSQSVLFEHSEAKQKGNRLILLMNAWFVGAIASALSAILILMFDLPWQVLAGLPILFGSIFGLLRLGTKESRSWLRAYVQKKYDSQRTSRALQSSVRDQHWGRKAVRNFVFLSVFWFCQALPVTALLMFGPSLIGAFEGGTLIRDIEKLALTDIFFLLGSLSALWVIPRFSRLTVIASTFLIMGGALAILSFGASLSPFVLTFFLVCYALAYGFQSVLDYLYPAELFPTSIRSTALGLLSSVSRIGVFAAALGFPFAFARFGASPLLLSGAALLLFGAFYTVVWPPKS